jgi:formylglycine-generating enzyme required for sulfatase activity
MNSEQKFTSARIALSISGMIMVMIAAVACSNTDNWLAIAATEISAPTLWVEGTPISSPAPVKTEPITLFIDDHGVPMALVPAGPFEMGSYDGADDEQPVHTVALDVFYMDQYEVTNSQYAICVDAGICDPTTDTTAFESSYSRRIYYGNPEYADYPVIYANWYEAQKYCEWRGARLPTEAEWEKAARGGLEGKSYPWGNESPLCESGAKNGAKFDDDGVCNDTDTEQVGGFSPNGYGLYDMAGNVWEWVSDFYDADYYASSPANNPSGPEDGSYPVVRGGSWNSRADRLSVSDRRFNDPKSGALDSGFRCARDVIP